MTILDIAVLWSSAHMRVRLVRVSQHLALPPRFASSPRLRERTRVAVVALAALAASSNTATLAAAQSTTRVSVTSSGAQASGGHSEFPSVSHDGRYVAYQSRAPLLVPEDTNAIQDVFVHDRYTGAVQRVSVSSSGSAGNGSSDLPSISANGRYVAFHSSASNFEAAPINNYIDVYVRDLQLGTTTLASKDSSGAPSTFGHSLNASISANGAWVAFESDSNQLAQPDNGAVTDVFVHGVATGQTNKVSLSTSGLPGTGHSYKPSLSGDGMLVAFQSVATNLAAGDNNNRSDIFVRDWLSATPTTALVSRSSAGVLGNGDSTDARISADGKFVAFTSTATNLVPGDTNGAADIFVRDLVAGTTERVSVSSAGAQTSGFSQYASISADGRYVVFQSAASDLVAGDSNSELDVFRRDRLLGTTTLVSVASGGTLGNQASENAAISGDGRFVAWDSSATNLVAGDTNARDDVFFTDPAGCAPGVSIRSGAGNVPSSLTANGQPIAGNTGFALVYHNPTGSCGVAPGAPVVTALDFNGALALPSFDGCAGGTGTLLVNLFGALPPLTITGVWSGSPGMAPLPIPLDTTLCGLGAHGQAFFVALPSLAIHPSDAVDIVVGQ